MIIHPLPPQINRRYSNSMIRLSLTLRLLRRVANPEGVLEQRVKAW